MELTCSREEWKTYCLKVFGEVYPYSDLQECERDYGVWLEKNERDNPWWYDFDCYYTTDGRIPNNGRGMRDY